MAKEKDWLYESQGCNNCGEIDFIHSKVEGLCQECLNRETDPYWDELEELSKV